MLHSDSSNEGIIQKLRPEFNTQLHPEAKGGPIDTAFHFDIYLESARKYKHCQQRLALPSRVGHSVGALLLNPVAKGGVGVQTGSVTFASTSRRLTYITAVSGSSGCSGNNKDLDANNFVNRSFWSTLIIATCLNLTLSIVEYCRSLSLSLPVSTSC